MSAFIFFLSDFGNDRLEPLSSQSPLHQPETFCQTRWWRPFLTSSLLLHQQQQQISTTQDITNAARAHVSVCVIWAMCAWYWMKPLFDAWRDRISTWHRAHSSFSFRLYFSNLQFSGLRKVTLKGAFTYPTFHPISWSQWENTEIALTAY